MILPSWRFRDYRADRCPHGRQLVAAALTVVAA